MRINFDFTDLEAFLAVFESHSFQAAAIQLAVSQSAVTRRIQKLETALDVNLFERTTRRLKPTFAAKEFYPRAQAIMDDAGEALRALGDSTVRYQYQRNAIVTIATIPTLTHDLIPRVLRRFTAAKHSARINILDQFAPEVSESVGQGEADFGIGFLGMQEPGLEFEFLFEDRFVLALRTDHPLAAKAGIDWEELSPYPLIVPQRGGGNRMLIDNALAKSQKQLEWAYQVRYSSTMLELVRTGIGIAILPASVIASGEHPWLRARPLRDPLISRSIGSVRRSNKPLSEKAQTLYRLLIDECGVG